jgi:hypothetical protein
VGEIPAMDVGNFFFRFYFTAPRGNCKLISSSLFLPAEQKRAASPEAAQHIQYITFPMGMSILILSDICHDFLWNIPS